MKKIIFAVISALALGLFASCQNGAQDVNITGSDSWQKSYVYDVTGTYTTYNITSKWDATTSKTVYSAEKKEYEVSSNAGMVEWTNFGSRNKDEFSVNSNNLNYKTASTDTTYTTTRFRDTIKKINGKYYYQRTSAADGSTVQIEVTVTGNLTDSKFTLTIPAEVQDTTTAWPRTNDGYTLTFTRK